MAEQKVILKHRLNYIKPSCPCGHRRSMKIILRVQGAKGSRFQGTCLRATHRQEGVELKTLEPLEPGILEPYFRIKPFTP